MPMTAVEVNIVTLHNKHRFKHGHKLKIITGIFKHDYVNIKICSQVVLYERLYMRLCDNAAELLVRVGRHYFIVVI